jgi:hypothetical protein
LKATSGPPHIAVGPSLPATLWVAAAIICFWSFCPGSGQLALCSCSPGEHHVGEPHVFSIIFGFIF